MANTGAYPPPAGVAQRNVPRFPFHPAQQAACVPPKQAAYVPPKQAAYVPPKQAAYTPRPYLPVAPVPDPPTAQSPLESYMSTIWGYKEDRQTWIKAMVTASFFLVLLAAGVACIAVLTSGSSGTTTETENEVFRELKDPVLPEIHVKKVTPQRRSTPPVVTLPPETIGSTAPPTPPTISPRKALNERPMVCTMGSRISSGAMFPDDGLCDYIFYDSMYKDGRNLLLNPEGFQKDLRIFLDAYNTYKSTAFGIAFAFKKTRHLQLNLKARGRSPLSYFWDRDIFHFGIVDTPTTLTLKQAEVDAAMLCLKELDIQAETQRAAGHPSFIFFALVLLNYTLEDHYEKNFKDMYQPDVLISQGHYYSGDNIFAECRVLPPTMLTRPQEANNTYRHDLTMAVDTIRKLSRLMKPEKRTRWSVSVTMKGRWTSPLPGAPFGFLARCSHMPSATSFGSYAEVCHNPDFDQDFTYSQEQGAALARHSTDGRVLSFDNEQGLCKKLCRVQGEQPEQRFGIAAFDLDYDDFSNTCASINKYGNFSRLRALRKIVEFFRTNFKTDADEAACLQIVA